MLSSKKIQNFYFVVGDRERIRDLEIFWRGILGSRRFELKSNLKFLGLDPVRTFIRLQPVANAINDLQAYIYKSVKTGLF